MFESRCQGRLVLELFSLSARPHHSSTCICGQTHTLPHIYWAHRTTPFEGEWQRFIWRAKATLRLCASVCDFLAMSYQVPEGLFSRCCPFRPPCVLCELPCTSVFTRICELRKCMCVCLQGPPSRVLIGLALPSWVSDPGQARSRLAAEGASQPV